MRYRRRTELVIPFVQVALDFLSILGTIVVAYWIRFLSPATQWFPITKGIPEFRPYVLTGLAMAIIWLFIFRALGYYGTRRDARVVDEWTTIMKGISLGLLVFTSATFFYRGFSYSRLVFVIIWVLSILLLLFVRICVNNLERSLHRRGKGVPAVLVGSGKWGKMVHDKVSRNPGLGFQIVGRVGRSVPEDKNIPYLGPFSEIVRVIKNHQVEAVFITPSEKEGGQIFDVIDSCTGLNAEFYLIPDLLDVMTSRLRVQEIEGIPVLKIKEAALTGWKGVYKRVFDLIISLAAFGLALPFGLVAALAVKLGSRGPVFYSQERIGLDGRVFYLYKFRTMIQQAEKKTGPVWTAEKDPRVTAVGRILRRTSLDELPQLINVIKGEMSLVGPRPERPYFVEKFKKQIPKYLERHRVKSGMTGWAQVNGLRGNVSIEDRTRYDVFYVENWSPVFDIKIIFMTLITIIRGENSY